MYHITVKTQNEEALEKCQLDFFKFFDQNCHVISKQVPTNSDGQQRAVAIVCIVLGGLMTPWVNHLRGALPH